MTDPQGSNAAARLTGWRAAAVWLITGLLLTVSVVCVILIPEREAMPRWALLVFTTMAASLGLVGALIVTRQPRNAVGWILWVASIGVAVSTVAAAYSNVAVAIEAPLPASTVFIAWLSEVGLTPAITGIIIFIPLLFPNGRLLTRRWRWVAAYGVVMVSLVAVANMFMPGPINDYPGIDNPFGIPVLAVLREPIEYAKGPGIVIAAILAIASAFARYRRAAAVERTQLRWFGAATGFTISLFTLSVVGAALPPVGGVQPADVGWVGGIASMSLIPVAIGIAILRYRLYEIDRLVSRTIGWAIVTGVLVAVFAGLVVALQAILAPVTNENTLAVAASTLVAFALFQPVRRRVQRAVDRRFDRARYDGQRTVDDFAERLRNEVDLGNLTRDVARVATETVRPASTVIWLRNVSDSNATQLS